MPMELGPEVARPGIQKLDVLLLAEDREGLAVRGKSQAMDGLEFVGSHQHLALQVDVPDA